MKIIITISFVLIAQLGLKAQVALPYYSGFDTPAEKAGWVEYKKAATTFSHWGYSTGHSAPSSIGHDYSPSTGITLTDNWFVSPAFFIPNGGTLDSVWHMFPGLSQPAAGDTIALYLLTGSSDPDLATSKTLLFDFRDTNYISDNTYRFKANIPLAASSDSSFVAIRYRNSDCSSRWITVHFDNITISANNTTNISMLNETANKINIHPNPTNGKIFIDSHQQLSSLEIYTATGKQIYSEKFPQVNTTLDLSSYNKGVYFLNYKTKSQHHCKKIILQ